MRPLLRHALEYTVHDTDLHAATRAARRRAESSVSTLAAAVGGCASRVWTIQGRSGRPEGAVRLCSL